MSKRTESIFELDDYRTYMRTWATARGRGEFRKMAQALGIHSTLVSQILNGHKNLTEDQASRLCSYMGLNHLETDYLLKLVQIERAGTVQLKEVYHRHLTELKDSAAQVKNRVPQATKLSDQDRALFYSSWQYSYIRLLTSIEKYQTPAAIALRLNITVSRVQEVLDFLTAKGLCKESQGRYLRTEKNTHIEARSPLAVRHHQNWRAKSIALMEQIQATDLAFTAPVALAKKDLPKVRSILLDTIAEISGLIEKSPSEEVAYLGIDWIKI